MIYGGPNLGGHTQIKQNKPLRNSETRPPSLTVFEPIDSQPAKWQHKIPDNKVERTPMALPASVPARVVYEKNWAKTKKRPWSMGHYLFLRKIMEVEIWLYLKGNCN